MTSDPVAQFLRDIEDETGVPAVSEAKMHSLTDRSMSVLVTEDERILALGVAALHSGADGATHHALETAVRRSMQFPEFEEAVATSALALVPHGPVSFWSMRETLDVALARLGFRARRTLLQMSVELPLTCDTDDFRSLGPGEEAALIELNNAAFASHREAGNLTRSAFDSLVAEPWFDVQGILVAVDDDELTGFCWTKLHPGAEGEIYRIAVDPDVQGEGLGRKLVMAGFAHLSDNGGAETGTLWVDESNRAAVELYESIGMRPVRRNREFERSD